jgi:small subunit ribosomal protein S21
MWWYFTRKQEMFFTQEAREYSGKNDKEVINLAFVVVEENESIERALKRFKRKVQREAIMRDYKKSSVYLKPGDKRRMKEARARKRIRRFLRRRREREY